MTETKSFAPELEALLSKTVHESNRLYLQHEISRQRDLEMMNSAEGLESRANALKEEVAEFKSLAAGQPTGVAAILFKEIAMKEVALRKVLEEKEKLANVVTKEIPVSKTPSTQEKLAAVATKEMPDTEKPSTQVALEPKAEEARVIPEAFQLSNFITLRQYGWDQGKTFVTVYITISGLSEQRQVHCAWSPTAFDLRCIDCEGKHYRLAIPNLCSEVLPADCAVTVKPNSLKLKMKKARTEEWEGLDRTERDKKAQHSKLASEGASTEELLRNMYNQADDKTRQELAQAAMEGQKKREAAAKKLGQ